MARHPLKIADERLRAKAHLWVEKAPIGAVVTIDPEPKRSTEQNAIMWACLTDISNQHEHNGAKHSPETWKALMMHSIGYQARFLHGLDGEVFPVGFRSSQLSVGEMSKLIEWIFAWGAENGIKWSDRGFKG
jgi:hypothetical protein